MESNKSTKSGSSSSTSSSNYSRSASTSNGGQGATRYARSGKTQGGSNVQHAPRLKRSDARPSRSSDDKPVFRDHQPSRKKADASSSRSDGYAKGAKKQYAKRDAAEQELSTVDDSQRDTTQRDSLKQSSAKGGSAKRDSNKRDSENRVSDSRGSAKSDFANRDSAKRDSAKGGSAKRDSVKRASAKVSPARVLALQCLDAIRTNNAYASEVIDAHVDTSSISKEDRAFATKLILGVVSCVGTLDEIINRCLDSVDDVQDDVREVLRLGTYEMYFLDKDPYAAVDQGVKLVRTFCPNATGLVNAVLRRISRAKADFPFGDPRQDPDAFARYYCFPRWLSDKIIRDLGPQAAAVFFKESNNPSPLFIATNSIKASAGDVEKVMALYGERASSVSIAGKPLAGCYRIEDKKLLIDPALKKLLAQGKALVSDASSQFVSQAILPDEKPSTFLEIGAGRGTKTILIQSAAQEKWGSQIETYYTLDDKPFKSELTAKRAEQFGVCVTGALNGDATRLSEVFAAGNNVAPAGETSADETPAGETSAVVAPAAELSAGVTQAVVAPTGGFDMIFIDAPCSGLGTLRRHPEIRWRLQQEDIDQLASVQRAMLETAAAFVRVGGTLCYATCTVTVEENINTVKAFLSSEQGKHFKLAPLAGASCYSPLLTPSSPDAHFAVRFIREN